MEKFNPINLSPSLLEEDVMEKPKVKMDLKLKHFVLTQIDTLLQNYSNEIPKEIIHSDDIHEGGKDYKVRAAWFATIEIILRGIAKKYLPKEFCDEALALLVSVKLIDPRGGKDGKLIHITTKEEIEKGDDLLRRAKILLQDQ